MLDTSEQPYSRELSDGLVLRTAASIEDVERVAQFNGLIHGHGVIAMTRNIFLHHPHTRGRDLVFVEEAASGAVVSSLCLIPWPLSYEGARLLSGEMGIVGTLESYRRRGLIREQVKYFKERLSERACVLSHIQGIWYYYRQFGYEYAMPLDGGLLLTARNLPPTSDSAFSFRLAQMDDVPVLMTLFDNAAGHMAIHSTHDEPIWRYLQTYSQGTEMESEVWIAEDRERSAVGYMRLPKHHFGEELTVSEVSEMNYDAALASLHHVVKLATERKTPGVRLCLPANSAMMRLARSLGAYDMGTYAWQIHIPSIRALLTAIAPALEQRVARSMFAGLTLELTMRFFQQTVGLVFRQGKLVEIGERASNVDGVVTMPPQAFTQLVLGYRSFDELHAIYPDSGVSPAYRLLVDTLFPKAQSFLYTIY